MALLCPVVTVDEGFALGVVLGINFIFFEEVFAANFPFALMTILTVQNPATFVVMIPLFKVQAPETDQTFLPVELVEAIDDVRYLDEGSNCGIDGFD